MSVAIQLKFVRVITLIQVSRAFRTARMHFIAPKESVYEIQPWNEEPSAIPQRFMTSTNFAKTSFPSKPLSRRRPGMQITADTVYFIKNNLECSPNQSPTIKRYPRTTQSSPRMRGHTEGRDANRKEESQRIMSSTQSANRLYKKKSTNPQAVPLVHPKKNLIFEFKTIKKRDSSMLNRTKSQFLKNGKETNKSNLLQIYQKSTTANEQKRSIKIDKDICDILEKRKLKTEKDFERQECMKSILLLSSKSQQEPKTNANITKNLIRSETSNRSKELEKDSEERMQFHLLMERKLFLLRNNMSKWQTNAKSRPSSRSIKK